MSTGARPSRGPWPVLILLTLTPAWLIGALHRGLWTPDEPREADIAWRMSLQSDRSVPQLGSRPFLEKPPLSYWLSGTALRALGDRPAALRSPNLLYAGVLALAAIALLSSMGASALGAAVAAGFLGTALLAFRVTVWLAPDAALLAGCAVALAGAYCGYTAPRGRGKLLGYTMLHLGCALGFMAKSAPGWIVPALALGALIVWERRWSELRCAELYAGVLLQALVIGPWLLAVAHRPDGFADLEILLWHNTIGRFAPVPGAAGLDYTSGHANSIGKYLLELPVYVLPWTFLAVAALARASGVLRSAQPAATAWRFAVCAVVPFLALLSVAATARDVYSAPALIGLGALLGLWADDASRAPPRGTWLAVRSTIGLVAVLVTILAGALGILSMSYGATPAVAAVAILLIATLALARAWGAQRRCALGAALTHTYLAYASAVCLVGLSAFPVIDGWQDLRALSRRIQADTQENDLALLTPDETTIAMLDHGLQVRCTILASQEKGPKMLTSEWFTSQGRGARVLVLLPGHGAGPLTPLLERLGRAEGPDDGLAAVLVDSGIAALATRYELPHGRRYALLAPRTMNEERTP